MSSVTVAVVAICGMEHLRRCLEALCFQVGAPPFDVVVVYDPRLENVEALREQYPDTRIVANDGQTNTHELVSRAIRETDGDLLLLTEDHCVPKPDWVRRLCDAQQPDRAAVGGAVSTVDSSTSVDWAFYFVDFFRYAQPVPQGPSPSLTLCNVSYQRSKLEQIRPLWEDFFYETAINGALRERFGPLWLSSDAEVCMGRHVRFADAVYERYVFGRLFGSARLQFSSRLRRLYYALLAPVLPLLLIGRMMLSALVRRRLWLPFGRAFPALIAMVVAWSWGEWLGYVTCRCPVSLSVAPEIKNE